MTINWRKVGRIGVKWGMTLLLALLLSLLIIVREIEYNARIADFVANSPLISQTPTFVVPVYEPTVSPENRR